MPPRASSRLNVVVIPGSGLRLEAVGRRSEPEALLAALGGISLMEGGEGALRAGASPRERFFACGQGGFRVSCPVSGTSVADRFWRALEAWRAGGARVLACRCGAEHDLEELDFTPPAGFSSAWIEARDAASLELTAHSRAVLQQEWPGFRVIGSRG